MKRIYTFKIDDAEKKKTEIFFSKPKNSEVEDAEYVYAQKFNQLLSSKFMSRAMMNKLFGDIGGIYSEESTKEISNDLQDLMGSQQTIEFFKGGENLTDEQKEKLKEAEETFLMLQKKIAENDANLKQMYAQSADTKAEEYMIKWFLLNCSFYTETIEAHGESKTESFPLFDEGDFAEKEKQYDEYLEDIEDYDPDELKNKKAVVSNSIGTLNKVITLWYNGYGVDQDSITTSFPIKDAL